MCVTLSQRKRILIVDEYCSQTSRVMYHFQKNFYFGSRGCEIGGEDWFYFIIPELKREDGFCFCFLFFGVERSVTFVPLFSLILFVYFIRDTN